MPRHPLIASISAALLGATFASASSTQPGATPPVEVSDIYQIHQLPRGPKDPTNAALLYNRIWLDPAFADLSRACGDALRSGDPAWFPDAGLVKELTEHRGIIAMLLRATEAPDADFGVEWSQGIGALMPHLGKLRGSARIIACDARRCVAEGKLDEGAERIAAIYRMSRHSAHDQILISALVSAAINSLAVSSTEALIKGGHMTVTGKRTILDEMRRTASAADPFGIKRGIGGERHWTCDWLRTFCKGPNAGDKLARQIIPLMGEETVDEDARTIAGMNEEAVNAELDICQKFYDDTLAVWDAPDAADRLREIAARLGAGEYGIIAKVLVPALGKAQQSDVKGRASLAEAIKRIESHVALQK